MIRYAAIFDVDGVLVDSYGAHLRSWRMLASETGASFSQEQFAATFGQTSREIIGRYWREHNLTPQRIAELDARKESLYREIVEREFPAMDGAPELLRSLHQSGFAIGLGTSGPKENVELAVRKLDIGDVVSAIVTGEDVKRGKPDPEVFLLAAKRLGVQPSRCIVIEDAPAGIAAARAAGMAAIALLSRGRSVIQFQRDMPDFFIDSLDELSAERLQEVIDDHH